MVKGKELSGYWDTFVECGSEDAFYILYSHYHDYFMFLGVRKGVNSGKIKDCINDLFLYLFENRGKLIKIENHHNYLITSFIRKLFKKEKIDMSEELDALTLANIPYYPSVEAEYISRNTNDHKSNFLKRYIDKLSHSQAQMIYQKFYLGLSYEQISKANGITVKTAYNTIYNAIERLKKDISKEDLGIFMLAVSLLGLILFF